MSCARYSRRHFILGTWLGGLLALSVCLVACPVAPGISGGGDASTARCGNGLRETGEACDGSDLGGATCASLGLGAGTLQCEGCRLDLGACTACGDGLCAAAEDRHTCPADCGYRKISAGQSFVCAMLGDGTAWCWGENLVGELGIGTDEPSRSVPTRVEGIEGATDISTGMQHACAVKTDGTVWCWGCCGDAIGSAIHEASPSPRRVASLDDAVSVGCGNSSTCALRANGMVTCWGGNSYGAIGADPVLTTSTPTPHAVSGIDAADELVVGMYNACARLASGRVVCWGEGEYGALGNGDFENQFTPVEVAGLTDAVALVGGCGSGSVFCAVTGAGESWCWGVNAGGMMGDGTYDDIKYSPVRLTALSAFDRLAIGAGFSCAILPDATARCWGMVHDYTDPNNFGQLGAGLPMATLTPVRVVGLEDLARIFTGAYNGFAVQSDGTAWAWGLHHGYMLGIGTGPESTSTPLELAIPD